MKNKKPKLLISIDYSKISSANEVAKRKNNNIFDIARSMFKSKRLKKFKVEAEAIAILTVLTSTPTRSVRNKTLQEA